MKKCGSILLLALWVLCFCSCKKEIDVIGLNLQDEDILGADFTEVTISAHSILEDSLPTKGLLNNVVGTINDPVFGQTAAGFCTQFTVSGSNTVFPKQAVLDSVVLNLQYSGYFGDTMSPIRFSAFELAEALTADQYYSNDDNPQVHPTDLVYNSTYIRPLPTTPVKLDTATTAAHLRLRLTNEFGERLLHMTHSQLVNESAFQNAFYGLCVRAEAIPGRTGNLCYMSLTSAMTGITLYYRVGHERKKYTFPVSNTCVRYNFYTHDYTRGDIDFQRQVLQGDTTLGTQTLYLQPTGGVKTRVTFADLKQSFEGKNVIINRAELVLTNVSADEDYFFQPYNLGLQVVSADGTTTYTPDDATLTSSSYFGGIYDEKTKEYRFRITNYVQQKLKPGNSDSGLNIVVSGAGVRGNRLVFRGTDNIYTDRARLEIYYTEY